MPVVIPVIVAFASGAVAAVVAGTATFAAYATVAGAVLSVAGAITHNKDLSRIGAFVGLAGGLYNMASGATSGAANIDQAATAGDYVNSADAASDAASAASTVDTASNAVAATAPAAAPVTGIAAPDVIPADVSAAAPAAAPTSFAQQAAQTAQQSGLATADAAPTAAYSGPGSPGAGAGTDVVQTTTPTALDTAAKSYTANDLNSWWQKAMDAGKGVGKFVKDNKELVNMAGTALTNMYGPQSEALDYQKSLMERARRNINSPVVLTYQK